ncbi:predicted protein [Sclerotinia sclerotiorum 1980 UF-70]|uniref:Uncharacterized protein n=1 Tax=Sclerotinia sclerotiorum (strain ATCC 18683 / 1980 / Ss-1) TaxID=665079 RepID=A7F8R9_SCLS1|nr:predicted protein [Sclerotinia sclerotiorum 1980 UF-70]EDN99140.1 predicted protein [Sclerotinia sclerotiorum 1980 UF-70]
MIWIFLMISMLQWASMGFNNPKHVIEGEVTVSKQPLLLIGVRMHFSAATEARNTLYTTSLIGQKAFVGSEQARKFGESMSRTSMACTSQLALRFDAQPYNLIAPLSPLLLATFWSTPDSWLLQNLKRLLPKSVYFCSPKPQLLYTLRMRASLLLSSASF